MKTAMADEMPIEWSERQIGRALARQIFNGKYLVVVPNCTWTGHECDILAITDRLRVIDVEIKISRSDLKADAKKEKWSERVFAAGVGYERRRLEWPQRVWKHYYALPAKIWTDELLDCLASPASGVLLLDEYAGDVRVTCRRAAQPCRQAESLSPAAAVSVARLASLRMWDAYREIERLRHDAERLAANG